MVLCIGEKLSSAPDMSKPAFRPRPSVVASVSLGCVY